MSSSEEESSIMTDSSNMDIHPSLMVIPSYAQMQEERSVRRHIVKARFYNLYAPSDPSAMNRKENWTQTPLDNTVITGGDIILRAELVIKDKTISALKEKIAHMEKLNKGINHQLIKSSFAHTDKDTEISDLGIELATVNKELEMKEILLVDYERSKEREAEMVNKLSKQHMVILRLKNDLNEHKYHLKEMSKMSRRPQY